MKSFLSIPEEILLLTIDEKSGSTKVEDTKTLDVVLASSILMHLALENRIDTDLQSLFLTNADQIGDVILDEVLKEISDSEKKEQPAYWITQIGLRIEEIKETIVSSLVAKGVLKVEENKILWVFKSRKYPVKDDSELKEVKARVRELVFSEEIPDLRDMVIISLAHYGSMLNFLFTDEEAKKHAERIAQIAKMDLIGQNISKALEEFSHSASLAAKAKSLFGGKTPEQKLDEMIENLKVKFRIKNDENLPEWIRKGTAQYEKTLAFVKEKGTAEIYYNRAKKQYFVKSYSYTGHTFGGGA